jgi:hypothetical protein
MNDKEFAKVGFIALGLLLLWWLWMRKQAAAVQATQAQAPTTTTSDPEQDVFANGPPPIASLGDGSTLNVNIANQGLGYLSSQYIPLFGFVGMAQGVSYQ